MSLDINEAEHGPSCECSHTWLICALTIAVCLVVIRKYMSGTPCKSKAKLDGKTVLITGANTGIGKETARDLARRGARVLLACRDISKAEKAAEEIRLSIGNPDVVVYKLDLASLTSVRQCASNVIANEHRLDVLINNAGICSTPFWKTEDGFEMQFGTNHLGHFLLTVLLLDLLKKSAPSRIINVSALGHTFEELDFDNLNGERNYQPLATYAKTKLCNRLFTLELSKQLKGSNVTANSVHPGVVGTEVARYIINDSYNSAISWLLALVYHCFFKHMMKTPVEGAQTSVHCAVAAELEGVSGKHFRECAVDKEPPVARDEVAAGKLWAISEEMVGIA